MDYIVTLRCSIILILVEKDCVFFLERHPAFAATEGIQKDLSIDFGRKPAHTIGQQGLSIICVLEARPDGPRGVVKF